MAALHPSDYSQCTRAASLSERGRRRFQRRRDTRRPGGHLGDGGAYQVTNAWCRRFSRLYLDLVILITLAFPNRDASRRAQLMVTGSHELVPGPPQRDGVGPWRGSCTAPACLDGAVRVGVVGTLVALTACAGCAIHAGSDEHTPMSTPVRPVIFGCAGPVLTEEERRFFTATRPCGFILFKRNCEDVAQLKALVASMREVIDDPLAPIFIDQEGGRVLRMKRPVWWQAPASGLIGKLADRDVDAGVALARDTGRAIGAQLGEVGVNVNFAPCLDVVFPYTHDAIGDRAFHSDPRIIAALGRAYIDGMAEFGVQGALKHLPGHGRARLDSHYDLPVIEVGMDELALDLAPFVALNDLPWGIVSHLLFPALDPTEPATTSGKIIADVVRGRIGFQGLLVTDDISMKALKAPVEVSSTKALAAGCDIVCHCNGQMAEMAPIGDAIAPMSEDLARRFEVIRAPVVMAPFTQIADLAADIDRRAATLSA